MAEESITSGMEGLKVEEPNKNVVKVGGGVEAEEDTSSGDYESASGEYSDDYESASGEYSDDDESSSGESSDDDESSSGEYTDDDESSSGESSGDDDESSSGDSLVDRLESYASDEKELYEAGSKAMVEKDYAAAVDIYRRALNLRVARHGKDSQDCVYAYHQYGMALRVKQQYESSAFTVHQLREVAAEEARKKREEEEEDVVKREMDESDMDLAWRVLNIAKGIVDADTRETIETVEVYSELGAVALNREDFN